ncbi:MAG: hypothetical protein M1812_004215 [Candelaria pacifica]|nr:MAG: hypothetical protein M1812_004215 [Candelaria pacifica]
MYILPHIVASICLTYGLAAARSQIPSPLKYLSLIENPNIHTPSHRVNAFSTFDIVFDLHRAQQRIKLSLEPNHDIIPDGAAVQYLGADGKIARTEPIDRQAHKVFKGYAWVQDVGGSWTNQGWARITVRRDGIRPLFEGAFTIMHDHHHIKLKSSYMSTKHESDPVLEESEDEYMVIFRDSDFAQFSHSELKRRANPELSCHSDRLSFNAQPDHPVYANMLKRDVGYWGSASMSSLFGKRQIDTNGIPSGGNSGGVNLAAAIGQTSGCPSTRKVALVGVAADCTYGATFNSTETARQNVITQMNSASDLYEKTFNITLGLANLTVTPTDCPGGVQAATPWNVPCAGNITIEDRLNTFSQWRGKQGDNNAFWMLLTTCNTGAAVGLSWLGQACNNQVETAQDTSGVSESVSGANVVAKTSTEWQVMAHETGHTFGAVHDCTEQTCSDGKTVNAQQCCPLSAAKCDAGEQYIMNPSTGQGITAFSPCSIGNICSAIGRNSVKTGCLSANKGVVTISGSQCGNGIVEDGEDCDCGGTECGNNNCCNPTTCKFKNNAVCDDSNEECCKNCQLASNNVVCRASTGVCDPQETCSGTSPTCPADKTAPDGQSCTGNSSASLQCASGQCTSRDLQCKTLMGSYTQKNDTYACNSNDCTLSCASPEFGANVCYGMQQNFLDGTVCGGGGKCQNGICKGSSFAKEAGSWINSHKALVIGIAAGLGTLVLLFILGCCVSCFRRRKRAPSRKHQSWPQQQQQQQNWSRQQMRGAPGWGGTHSGNHFWQQPGPYPPPPPPHLTQPRPSVRYA